MNPSSRHKNLPRLPEEFYRGRVTVHWIMCIRNRETGWLTERLHARLRELLVHACCRFEAVCLVYCLMPDHGHFLVRGASEGCEQRGFVRFLRRQWNALLQESGHALQRQPYDHVLRGEEDEGEREGIVDVVDYIAANPVRAGLAAAAVDWPYTGTIMPGYPDLDLRRPGDWRVFWEAVRAFSCAAKF